MIRIQVINTHSKYRIPKSKILQIAQCVFKGEGVLNATCNLLFVGDKLIKQLNRTYLNRQYITDVLSFPLHETGSALEGEVYVNIDQARRQATDYTVTYSNELARLVIHGILHLIGYDDRTKYQRAQMLQREDKYLLLYS